MWKRSSRAASALRPMAVKNPVDRYWAVEGAEARLMESRTASEREYLAGWTP